MFDKILEVFKQKDKVAAIQEIIYFTCYALKRSNMCIGSNFKVGSYKGLETMLSLPQGLWREYVSNIPGALVDLIKQFENGVIQENKLQTYIDLILDNNEFINFIFVYWKLDYRTIHTELSEIELAEAVLYYFEKDNFNYPAADMYLSPLQINFRNMIELLGLEEQDYKQLWEEFISPKLHCADYYTHTGGIIFELLRKKKMKTEIKVQKSIEGFRNAD